MKRNNWNWTENVNKKKKRLKHGRDNVLKKLNVKQKKKGEDKRKKQRKVLKK